MSANHDRAIDAPGVRAALSRQRRQAWGVLVGGLLLFVGFVTAATVVADRTEELERDGVRVAGRVLSYSPGGRLTSEHVDVEFTFGGERRTERVQLDDSSPIYEEEESVVVIVDPQNPSRLTIEGETNQSTWTVWLMIGAFLAGLIGIVAGPWVLFRTRRQRGLLSSAPWRDTEIQYIEVPSGNSVRGLVRIANGEGDHVLSLVSTARWNLARIGLRGAEEAQIVGDPSEYLVLRAGDGARLVSAKAPRTSRGHRRWRERFADQ